MIGKEQWLMLYLSCLQILGVLLFLYGFFPEKIDYKYSSMDDLPEKIDDMRIPRGVYKRQKPLIVLMIIDALRFDFVGENMPYLTKQLEKNENCFLRARVEPPTVTLPRIKALLTGSISSFYDVVANFGSVELKDDNLVSKAISSEMNVVFYGDDTWLKLFPKGFLRSEGTTSFFVNDFHEVDDNVTRHLDFELRSEDWDILVLHYLGLDHIGHVEGPFGSHIKPKLLEMDGIIQKINSRLVARDPTNPGVVVVCGDHGMKDSGGHGGTSLSEVLVPLVLLNYQCDSKLRYEEVKQVDLTPLLSLLLGLPIPGGSVGKLNAQMLSGLDAQTALYSLFYNTLRMFDLFQTTNPNSEIAQLVQEGTESYKSWILGNHSQEWNSATLKFTDSQKHMSSVIISDSVRFDDYILVVAIFVTFQVTLIILAINVFSQCTFKRPNMSSLLFLVCFVGFHYFSCTMGDSDSKLCGFSILQLVGVVCLFSLLFANIFLLEVKQIKLQDLKAIDGILSLGLVLHLVSLTSSSFIEEEHQFWYFALTTVSLYLLPFDYTHFTVILVLQIFLRKLNQTGDKWAHLLDISDWLNREENKYYLTLYFLLGLMIVHRCQLHRKQNWMSFIDLVFAAIQLTLILFHKVAVGYCTLGYDNPSSRGVVEARMFWLFSTMRNIASIYNIHKQKHSRRNVLVINLVLNNFITIITLISKPHNVFLLPSLFLFHNTFSRVDSKCLYTQAGFHHLLGMAFYFYQGNSNSIANIDVGVGYVGLEEYNLLITGLYIFLHTYSGPIFSILLLLKTLATNNMLPTSYKSFSVLLFVSSLTTGFYMIVLTFQRYHLFIWSVFAPKLMFICAQTCLTSLSVFSFISLSALFDFLTPKKIT